MAVRSSFTAGEVLTAADLTDTFASKLDTTVTTKGDLISRSTTAPTRLAVGSNGQVLTANSATTTGLQWSTPTEPGMVLVTTQSFTTSSAVSINSCFTSTYDNYRIVIDYIGSTATDVRFRLRVSGADNTTAGSYVWQRLTGAGGSAGASSAGADAWDIVSANTNHSLWSADVLSPARATRTGFLSLGFRTSGETVWVGGGSHTQTTSYDGFTFYPASGTVTGTLKVYGYGN